MESTKAEESKIKPKKFIEKIKSKYILKQILDNLNKRIFLNIIKYNKYSQKKLNISIKDYKNYSEIEIEVIPKGFGKFINFNEEDDEQYYHIYFDDDKYEKRRNYIERGEEVKKIKIIIDYQVKSFYKLFYWCTCIESINFKKFYRNNITYMSFMFRGCSSLKELNLNNFKTNNVTDMSFMFSGCSSLKELNLNNFNTKHVANMRYMFYECSVDLKRKIQSENKNIEYYAFW